MKQTAAKTIPGYQGIYNRFIKRLLDMILSAGALAFLWPVLAVCTIAVALDDGFPVLYRAERTGYGGRSFRICKFRSMVRNADRIGGGTTALDDPRITRVGHFLRSTKLDELPQLFQVLTGNMSLVGPRPELLCYTSRYRDQELDILKVRPGITDFSSIEFIALDEIVGPDNADLAYETLVLHRKNELRVRYAHNVSFLTDVGIVLRTAAAVLQKCLHVLQKQPQKAL